MPVSKDEIIFTFEQPESLDPAKPHIRNIFARPAKGGLFFDCYETGDGRYWASIEEFVQYAEVHDYFWKYHRTFPTFSAIWRTLCPGPAVTFKKGDLVLHPSGDIFKIWSVRPKEQLNIHRLHQERIRVLKAHQIDRRHVQKFGTLRTVGSVTELLHQDLRSITGGSRLVFNVLSAYRFATSRSVFKISTQKKLRAITNPTKRPRPINKYWNLSERIFEEYLEPVLSEASFPFECSSRKFEVRLRAESFTKIFNFALQTSNIEANRTGYLDFIHIKMNFRASVIRFVCVFLIRDEETGQIQGEDYMPSDWRSFR